MQKTPMQTRTFAPGKNESEEKVLLILVRETSRGEFEEKPAGWVNSASPRDASLGQRDNDITFADRDENHTEGVCLPPTKHLVIFYFPILLVKCTLVLHCRPTKDIFLCKESWFTDMSPWIKQVLSLKNYMTDHILHTFFQLFSVWTTSP